jgi:hypothetical protein
MNGDFESPVVASPYTNSANPPYGWIASGGVASYGALTTQYGVNLVTSADTTYGGGAAPSQNQYLVLEQASTYIQQSITLMVGTYSLTFYARARPNYSPVIPFSVYVNGVQVFGITLTTSWTLYTVSYIQVTSNITTIQFINDQTTSVGDLNYPLYDYFNELDKVSITKGMYIFSDNRCCSTIQF